MASPGSRLAPIVPGPAKALVDRQLRHGHPRRDSSGRPGASEDRAFSATRWSPAPGSRPPIRSSDSGVALQRRCFNLRGGPAERSHSARRGQSQDPNASGIQRRTALTCPRPQGLASDRGMAIVLGFGRADLARGLSGRGLQAEIGPGFQIAHCVDNSPANLSIGRPGSVGPMLLQSSA